MKVILLNQYGNSHGVRLLKHYVNFHLGKNFTVYDIEIW